MLFFDSTGRRYHGAAILYALAGYAAGVAGLLIPNPWINGFATLLLAHAMVIGAYLIHECAHNTIFRDNRHNARLGRLLSWVCGSAYGTFEDMRFKHFRHHVDNGDLVSFDYEAWFAAHPWVLKVTRALEWAYVPAHELIMHGYMLAAPFCIPERRGQRRRTVLVAVVRAGLFGLLVVYAPLAALLYAVAYCLMLIVLRLMDSLQHDYGGVTTLYDLAPGPRRGDLDWEQAHTFSNPLSLRHEKLNWLVLNFGFHNAHHARPTTPWFRLPEVHRDMYGGNAETVIPMKAQLAIYHRGRTARLDKWDAATTEYPTGPAFLAAARAATIPGGNAASFLTSF